MTGATSGIGLETCRQLAAKGAKVYLAGRSQTCGKEAVNKLRKETGNSSIEWLQVDLSDLVSVRRATDQVLAAETRLDALFNIAYAHVLRRTSVPSDYLILD